MAMRKLGTAVVGLVSMFTFGHTFAGEIAGAAIDFTLPPEFEPVRAEPPFLITAVNRKLATENARLRFFVPPAPSSVSAADALTAARYTVAGSGATIPDAASIAFDADGIVRERIERFKSMIILMVRKLDDRCVAVALNGDAEDILPLEAAARSALLGARALDARHPTAAGTPFVDEVRGVAIALPLGFVLREKHPSHDELARYSAPDHLGMPAGVEIAVMTEFLDRSLEDAGRAERERIQQENAENVLTRSEAYLGRFPSWRVTYEWKELVVDSLILDTARQRLRITFACSKNRLDYYGAAFERAMAEVKPIPRRIAASRAARIYVADASLALWPPRDFVRVEGEGDLLTLRQLAVKPPAAEIRVRLAGANPQTAKTEAEAIERATARRAKVLEVLADDGWEADGDVTPQSLSGKLAARYRLERRQESPEVTDFRTVLNVAGRDFEIAVSSLSSEFELLRPTFEATVASFTASSALRSPQLQEAISLDEGRCSVRPPDEWIESSTKSVAGTSRVFLRFEPAERQVGSLFWIGSTPLPPENPLIGSAERLRISLFQDLEKEGALVIRVEQLDAAWTAVRTHPRYPTRYLQIAYTLNGLAQRELCFGFIQEDVAYWARARCASDHFTENRELFLKAVASLEIPTGKAP